MENTKKVIEINDNQMSLILDVMSFAQFDKEQFKTYMNSMHGKKYSDKEFKELEGLRQHIKFQIFK